MIVREAILNDPDVIALVKERFIPIAVDNADDINLTRADKKFLEDNKLNFCTQGLSVFAADGTVLARGGGYEAERALNTLQEGLSNYKPDEMSSFDKPADPASIHKPPEGGLTLFVTWKVLGDHKPQSSPTTGDGHYDKTFQSSLGIDRLWVRADEAQALTRGEFPESLRRRMSAHVSYVLAGDVEHIDLAIDRGAVTGACLSTSGDLAAARGAIESSGGQVTRFDIVVKGLAEQVVDCGFSANLTVVPKGQKVPAAVLFTLANPNDELAKLPPYRSRGASYLE